MTSKRLKKLCFTAFMGAVLAAALSHSAFAYQLNVPFPGLPTQISGPAEYIRTIYTFGLGFGALLAMLMIVVGAFQYTLSEAITSKEDASERIKNAIIGLVLLLAAFLILNTINPQIPQLKEPVLTAVSPLPPGPVCYINASPSSGSGSVSGTLTWGGQGLVSCQASGSWNGPRGPSGQEPYGPITFTNGYNLLCSTTAAGGKLTVTCDATVSVKP